MDATDPRLADIIKPLDSVVFPREYTGKSSTVIIGYPVDEGVRRNGGRVGAAGGPSSFRALARKLCASSGEGLFVDKINVYDAGDITVEDSTDLEGAHEKLTKLVSSALQVGVPFVVGGGNDQSYANVCALMVNIYKNNPEAKICVINIDAHLDVRPMKPLPGSTNGKLYAHSGSPFRQMMEHPLWKKLSGKFIEFGCQQMQCSQAHAAYVRENNPGDNDVMWLNEIREREIHGIPDRWTQAETHMSLVEQFEDAIGFVNDSDKIFISFDLDSVRAADASGVSCSSPEGLSAQEAISIMHIAGRNPRVQLVDISEYNPKIEEYRTGRLVAAMFHSFLAGLQLRRY